MTGQRIGRRHALAAPGVGDVAEVGAVDGEVGGAELGQRVLVGVVGRVAVEQVAGQRGERRRVAVGAVAQGVADEAPRPRVVRDPDHQVVEVDAVQLRRARRGSRPSAGRGSSPPRSSTSAALSGPAAHSVAGVAQLVEAVDDVVELVGGVVRHAVGRRAGRADRRPSGRSRRRARSARRRRGGPSRRPRRAPCRSCSRGSRGGRRRGPGGPARGRGPRRPRRPGRAARRCRRCSPRRPGMSTAPIGPQSIGGTERPTPRGSQPTG